MVVVVIVVGIVVVFVVEIFCSVVCCLCSFVVNVVCVSIVFVILPLLVAVVVFDCLTFFAGSYHFLRFCSCRVPYGDAQGNEIERSMNIRSLSSCLHITMCFQRVSVV